MTSTIETRQINGYGNMVRAVGALVKAGYEVRTRQIALRSYVVVFWK